MPEGGVRDGVTYVPYEGVVEHSIVGDSTVIKAVELLRDGERYRTILQEQDTEKK